MVRYAKKFQLSVAELLREIPIETQQQEQWRRGWDSNPRYGFPHARFRGEYFKPLSHLSAAVAIHRNKGFCYEQSSVPAWNAAELQNDV